MQREYIKAFKAEFPEIDPNHTWMCVPDTVYEEVPSMSLTRNYTGAVPSVYSDNTYINMSYTDVQRALEFMAEAEENDGKCAQDFEYKAVADQGDNFETYTISPMFWGRKFCDYNFVGIYYIGSDGNKYNLDPFWTDRDNKITAVYKDGQSLAVTNGSQRIIDDQNLSNWQLSIPLTKACSECNGNQKVATTIKVKHQPDYGDTSTSTNPSTVTEMNMKNSYKVESKQHTQSWNSQFFVVTNRDWEAGETYRFHMWAKASKEVTIEAQWQEGSDGTFVAMVDNIPTEQRKITTEWKEIVWEGKIPTHSGKRINSIVLCLAQNDANVTYYFSDITLEQDPCPYCVGGKSPVDHYQLPEYTIKVPVGMKWGVYLKTMKQQKNDTSESNMITWYSNSQYNAKNQANDENTKAAATFTYNDVTYVSFEDAPTVCDKKDVQGYKNGECTACGRGHYDHDFNDIVLTITPRPVTSTYRSIKYRVMCEDLGGTFDWDFNDVVFDVIYADGKQPSDEATVSLVLQAVGGTLPIYIKCNWNATYVSEFSSSPIDYTARELHELLSGQNPDAKGLYTPVNVSTPLYQTIQNCPSQTVVTIKLKNRIYSTSELDIRNLVKLVTVQAYQNGRDKGPTSTVVFPKEGANAVPQCFMTSIDTPWADELQNITERYPRFSGWVAHENPTANWWVSDF